MTTASRRGAWVLCVLLASAASGSWAEASGEGVTFAIREFTNANRVRVLVFSGAVSNPEPGQDVEIVGQDCGGRGYRLIAATQTGAGGAYQAENPQQGPPWAYTPWSSGITFRARWNGRLSAPIQYRLPAPLSASKIPGRRAWKAHFSPQELRVGVAGRIVELQRFTGGRWVRMRTARLALRPSLKRGAFNHEAVFEVPRRGLRLRASLPARSAAPCWAAGASEPWRS